MNIERLNVIGLNYLDWICTLRYENKEHVLNDDLIEPTKDALEDDIVAYNTHYDESTKEACLMLVTMSSEL